MYSFFVLVEVGVSVDTSITLTEGEEMEVCLTTLGTVETDTLISISVIPETNGSIASIVIVPTNNSSHIRDPTFHLWMNA